MGEDESVYRQIVHPLAQQTLKTECAKLTDFTKNSKFLWILLPFFVKILTFLSRNLKIAPFLFFGRNVLCRYFTTLNY